MRSHRVQRSVRSRAAVALAVAGLAMFVLAIGSTSVGGATGEITVDQTPLPFDGACVPTTAGRASWRYDVDSTAEHFRLTVHNPSTLCDGVDAVAAIYTMPASGSWPQHLASTERFTIREASTTVITFTKDCQPAQFDVLTGTTPAEIDVTGPFHGPLLFPGALSTSQQYHASGCTTTTTTVTTAPPPTVAPTSTSSTTSSTSTTSTTSTTVASVAGASTTSTTPEVAAASIEQGLTATTVQPEVLAATASRGSNGSLAFTGSDAAALAGLGLLLLAAGTAVVAVARRRAQQSDVTRPEAA